MQKTAQKRNIFNKLREMTNVSGILAEKLTNKGFDELMDYLREQTDDPIRSIISGDKIGKVDASTDGVSAKEILKSARSNLTRREYMKVIADLGRFHKKMDQATNVLKTFLNHVAGLHEQFLFGGLDDSSKTHLKDLYERFNNKKAANQYAIIKEASILDFLINVGTKRGRALGAWEKRYPKQVGKLKKDTEMMLKESEKLLSSMLSSLKIMASARVTRNVDKYAVEAEKLIKSDDKYNQLFLTYYNENVKGFIEKIIDQEKPAAEVSAKVPELNMTTPSVESAPESVKPVEQAAPLPTVPPPAPADKEQSKTISVPPPEVEQDEDAFELATPKPSTGPKTLSYLEPAKKAHENFYITLEAMANEDTLIISSFIRKYAKSIENEDPETSLKLFNIIKSIA